MITKAAGIRIAKHLDRAVPHAWLIDQLSFVSPHNQAATGDKESLPPKSFSLSWATGGSLVVRTSLQEQPIETFETTASNQ